MTTFQIETSETAGVRFLHFGSEWVQGAMRIARPWALELEYTREMMLGLILRNPPWPRSVLMIGLGAGSLTKFIYRQLPGSKITVVEIDPMVQAAARQFFKLPSENERLNIEIGDGFDYMHEGKRRFDLILVDGYDENARAGSLDSDSFYTACRARLTRSGLVAFNFFGHRRGHKASVARLNSAFDRRTIFLPPCESGNVIGFGFGDESLQVSKEQLLTRANEVKSTMGLDLRPTLSRLRLVQTMPDGQLIIK